VEIEGELQVRCADQYTWFTVYGRDISTSGIGFISPVAFERGEEIVLLLPTSLGEATAVVRHVARRDGYWFVGVELDSLLAYEVERSLAHAGEAYQ
jgi:hypothetical protein